MKGQIKSWSRVFSNTSFRASYLLVLLLASLLLSVITPQITKATSAYDTWVHNASELVVNVGTSCVVDITANWSQFLGNQTTSFQTALNTGSWGVSRLPFYQNGNDASAIVYWNETQQMSATFSTDGFVMANNVTHSAMIHARINNQVCEAYPDPINYGPNQNTISYKGGQVENLLFTGTVIYPDGYAGLLIRDTFAPKTKVYPNITYEINNKTFTAIYDKNIPSMTECNTGNMSYTMFKRNNDNTETEVDYKPPTTNCQLYTFTATTNGKYTVMVVASKPIPFAPFPTDIDVQPRFLSFTIDGTSQTGNTSTDDCTNGACIPQPIFEDCSTHGTNLIAGFGCIMKNFGIYLNILFISLLKPHPELIGKEFSIITNNFNTQTGIQGIILAPLSLISSLTTSTCSTVHVPLPFVNRNIDLPCMNTFYTNYLGAFYTMYQIITSGLISYYVLLNMFSMIKGFKSTNDDRISATQL